MVQIVLDKQNVILRNNGYKIVSYITEIQGRKITRGEYISEDMVTDNVITCIY